MILTPIVRLYNSRELEDEEKSKPNES